MVNQVGVIGAGAMGRGIAQVAAAAGEKVVLVDTAQQALNQAETHLDCILDRSIEKGKITAEHACSIKSNIHYTTSLEELNSATLVVEAVVEDLILKKELFGELEKMVAKDCILATNTSSLSVSAIASGCQYPDRVIGLHFFNPAPLMALVEVVPALQTMSAVIEQARNRVDVWGKTTVIAQDTPGFIVNRIARPFYGEALRIADEGIKGLPAGEEGYATIDWAMRELGGFKMGPFELMDYIGNDINYTVTKTVYEAFFNEPRYKPSFTQKRLFDAGFLGRKSGRGYYNYQQDSLPPRSVEDEILGQQIVDRVLAMLINEAADAVFWQVATPHDIDLAMTAGVNYPRGLLAWADELGASACVHRMDALYTRYREERYRCSPLLREMSGQGKCFF